MTASSREDFSSSPIPLLIRSVFGVRKRPNCLCALLKLITPLLTAKQRYDRNVKRVDDNAENKGTLRAGECSDKACTLSGLFSNQEWFVRWVYRYTKNLIIRISRLIGLLFSFGCNKKSKKKSDLSIKSKKNQDLPNRLMS